MFEDIRESCAWIEALFERAPPGGALAYYKTHKFRYAYTLKYVAKEKFEHALELGSDGFMIHASRLILGKSLDICGATFSATKPARFDHVFWGDPEAQTFTMLNFNLQEASIPVETASMDFILFCEILEHMPADPMHVLAEINRVLRPGGKVLITTPNSAGALTLRRLLSGKPPWVHYSFGKDRSIYRHCFEYTPEVLADAMKAAGFDIELLTTHNCWSAPEAEEIALLKDRIPSHLIGDNIFAIAVKAAGVCDRWPAVLYS
jgi:SAM-dependent methyltransferase